MITNISFTTFMFNFIYRVREALLTVPWGEDQTEAEVARTSHQTLWLTSFFKDRHHERIAGERFAICFPALQPREGNAQDTFGFNY